jgi:hypothetical protein
MQQTKYPIYIISKGRWVSRMTSRTLEEIGMDYKIVIEQQEYDNYAAVIDPKKILVLPFSNLGQGSIPARNWVWEHAKAAGYERHWILDDNMRNFYRIHQNTKLRVRSSVPLRVCEDYTDRFENVNMSGLNYHFFIPTGMAKAPVYFNTRIYSCILLKNDQKPRWRVLEFDGKPAPFNEDTDLSLQILKEGNCSILLNSFTVGKGPTMKMKGGNTNTVYKVGDAGFDNRYSFAASLHKAHPDVCEITQKHGRWHHEVKYTKFQKNNKLKLKPGMMWDAEYPTKLQLVKLSDPKNINSSHTPISMDEVRMDLE